MMDVSASITGDGSESDEALAPCIADSKMPAAAPAKRGATVRDAIAQILRRLMLFAGLACVAYILSLLLFPGFIAPFAAFHSDMYIAPSLAARGVDFIQLLSWPRPLAFETLRLAGSFGFGGSLAFIISIYLLDLALAIAIFERFALGRLIPWWIAFATLLFAMAAPSFYFTAPYDAAFGVSLLFALFGVLAFETLSESSALLAVGIATIFFSLSVLAKEACVPAIGVYALASAYRRRQSRAYAVAICMAPLAALIVALVISKLTHSPFLNLGASATNPYHIGITPQSLWSTFTFYLSGLFNPALLVLLGLCVFVMFKTGRRRTTLLLLCASAAMYAPYLLLPNHVMALYDWTPIPILMLVVAAGLTWSFSSEHRVPSTFAHDWLGALVAVACVATIAWFRADNFHNYWWQLVQQAENRATMAGIRSVAPQLSVASNVLVVGMTNPFHPWYQADFLSWEAPNVKWTVASDPRHPAIPITRNARPIQYDRIHWSDYDRILVFDRYGQLANSYTAEELATTMRPVSACHLSVVQTVAILRDATTLRMMKTAQARDKYFCGTFAMHGQLLPQDDRSSIFTHPPAAIAPATVQYPEGIARGSRDSVTGVYPSTDGGGCCFLSGDAKFVITGSGAAHRIMLSLYVPAISVFQRAPESVTVFINGKHVGEFKVAEGLHDVTVPVPSSKASYSPTVELKMSKSYVPKELGLNGDVRTLSVMLVKVRAS